MKLGRFEHAFTVNCTIDEVWKFYTCIEHLEVITPKEAHLEVIRATSCTLTEGVEVWISGKVITKSTWHSRITYTKPYEYVDEMLSRQFKKWKHKHRFRKIGEDKTEVIDEIDFELPYCLLGKIFDGYAHNKIWQILAYRKEATITALEGK